MNTKVIDETGAEVLDPRKALAEGTLAVDLARADFDQAIATAHKYQRIIDTVIKQIETLACYNEAAAENCIYSLPRGGKPILGPSIGFANIVAGAWGNCIDGGRPTYTDRKEKSIYAEGIFHDLQSNRRTIIHESRRIVGRNGAIYNDDMIIVTGKAAAAIARRNAILNAVPRALWHPIYERALAIVRGDQETFAERKEKALKAFSQYGVKPEQVFMYLGLKGEPDLTLEHIPQLRGMYSALRDGSTTVEDMFDPRKMTGKGFETVADPLANHVDTRPADEADRGGTTANAADEPEPPAGEGTTAEATTVAAAANAGGGAQAQPDLLTGGGGQQQPRQEPRQEAARQDTAAAKPAAQATADKPKPTNAGEYIEHWKVVCAAATSETGVKQAYANERALRKDCEPFSEEQFDEMNRIKQNRIDELKKK